MYSNAEQLRSHLQRIVSAVESLPRVRDAAITDGLPLQGVPTTRIIQVVGHPIVDRALRPACLYKVVGPSYFRALNLHVRKGRALNDGDRHGRPLVAVINETMARLYFPQEDPVGRQILVAGPEPNEQTWEIVGRDRR